MNTSNETSTATKKSSTSKPNKNNRPDNNNSINRYARGPAIPVGQIHDRKLRASLVKLETDITNAATAAYDADSILLTTQPGYIQPSADKPLERTFKVRQEEIRQASSLQTAQNGRFELQLENTGLGPYIRAQYTRSGKGLLVVGKMGHVATVSDWRAGKLGCEMQLGESVRDATWLHDERTVAVAGKQYVQVYDMSATGSEGGVLLHTLRKHIDVTHLVYQPYHFLLASIGNAGWLKYTDVSTGQLVAELGTKMGAPTALTQNRRNAVLHVGHQNGVVSLWSPNCSNSASASEDKDGSTGSMGNKPLVKILAHRGPVRSVDIERNGRYMVSAGQDKRLAVWDVRMFREVVREIPLHRPASALTISDRGVVAVGSGSAISTWKSEDLFLTSDNHDRSKPIKLQHRPAPYMTLAVPSAHKATSQIHNLAFCPSEDLLGTCHTTGFTTSIIPGAGEPNPDALEPGTNPYANRTQIREGEVRALLDKIQPGMIALESEFIGGLDPMKPSNPNVLGQNGQRIVYGRPPSQYETDSALVKKLQERSLNSGKGKGGKNSALRAYMRKRMAKNIDVVDARRMRVEALEKEVRAKRAERRRRVERGERVDLDRSDLGLDAERAKLGPALSRFLR